MIWHHNLSAVRNFNLRHRYTTVYYSLNFLKQIRNIQRNTISDNTCRMVIKNAGRQNMKGKFTIIIYDSMTCITASLKAYDNIGLFTEHIRNLSFSFVSPVCSYNGCYHSHSSLMSRLRGTNYLHQKAHALILYMKTRRTSTSFVKLIPFKTKKQGTILNFISYN